MCVVVGELLRRCSLPLLVAQRTTLLGGYGLFSRRSRRSEVQATYCSFQNCLRLQCVPYEENVQPPIVRLGTPTQTEPVFVPTADPEINQTSLDHLPPPCTRSGRLILCPLLNLRSGKSVRASSYRRTGHWAEPGSCRMVEICAGRG